LILEDLFYRVQAVLAGRLARTTPQQRAHPDSHFARSCAVSLAVASRHQVREGYDGSPQVA
jgi:hypothetical protein